MSKKIIWIEDDVGIISPVVRPLERAGHKIVSYTTVNEALKHMSDLESADLLLVDMIHPPGKNNDLSHYPGLDLVQKVRNEFKWDIPIIVLTVVTNAEVKKQLDKLNIAAVINKPVRPSILKEEVEKALGI
ncbi:MAG: response regulator [Chloroflexota bacterium]